MELATAAQTTDEQPTDGSLAVRVSKLTPNVPILGDVTPSLAAQIRRLENTDMATAVDHIEYEHQEPKDDSSAIKLPKILFVLKKTQKDGKVVDRFTDKVVVHGPAVWFNAFGPLMTQKLHQNGPNYEHVSAGKTTRMEPLVKTGSTADDMRKRASVYSPFSTTMRNETTKIQRDISFTASVEGGNRLEIELRVASNAYHKKHPGIIFPHGDFDLPDRATMLADAVKDNVPKAPDGALVPLRIDTRCDHSNSIPIHVPFMHRVFGATPDKSPAHIRRLQEEINKSHADVVTAVFQDPICMSLTVGGFESFLRSADTIRQLFTEAKLDVTRLSEFFKSVDEKDIYVMRVPEIFGPSGEILSVKDLYNICYERPVELTPYVVGEMSLSSYKAPNKTTASVLGHFSRVAIIGYVPAQPIKVMATVEDSCVPEDEALAAVTASLNVRHAAPAIQAPAATLAIEAGNDKMDETEEDDTPQLAPAKRPHEENEKKENPRKRARVA